MTMYFLEQVRKQFLVQVVNYAWWEKATWVEDQKQAEWPKEEWDTKSGLEWAEKQVKDLEDKMRKTWTELAAWVDALKANTEKNEKIIPLSEKEVLQTIEFQWDEEQKAKENLKALWEWISDLEVKEHVFESRVDALKSNKISQWDKKVIEAEFISDIADKAWVNSELIWDLRALWFQWAQDWAEWDVAKNLEDMTKQLSDMKQKIEEEGWKFPTTKEEFLALYNTLSQNDNWKTNNHEMDPAAAAANWVNAIRNPNWWFQIDPKTEWYRQVWDMVVWPVWAPYSRWWQVFSGTGEINKSVKADLDRSYDWLGKNPWLPMSPDMSNKLKNSENQKTIEKAVPVEWHWAAIVLANMEWVLKPSYPIALASMDDRRGIVCYPDGRIDEFPIIIWRWWHQKWAWAWWGGTPTYNVMNFNMNTKVTAIDQNAANSNKANPTVLWASLQHDQVWWGKWWHWVAQSRMDKWQDTTLWCIWANQESMMLAWNEIKKAWWGYWININTKQG